MLDQKREERSWGVETLGDEGRKSREGEERGRLETQNRESRVKEEGKNEAWSRGREKGNLTNTETRRRRRESEAAAAAASHFLSEGKRWTSLSLSFPASFRCTLKRSHVVQNLLPMFSNNTTCL